MLLLGGYGILGPYGTGSGTMNQYFERTYTGLPRHNQLNLNFVFLAIDGWDFNTYSPDDSFQVYVDGYIQNGWTLSTTNGGGISMCGSISWNEWPPLRVYSQFIHSDSSVTLRFISKLDEDSTNESFGIREIKMRFHTLMTPTNAMCGYSTAAVPDRNCPCDYTNPTASCYQCHSDCNTCYGPNSNQCSSCYDGKYLLGNSCYSCHSNCNTCSGSTSACTSCNSGNFLAGNMCFNSCNSPLYSSSPGGILSCFTPCPGQKVFWDGSCGDSCIIASSSSPFTTTETTMNTYPQCEYPCGSNQYLYWNTSCLSTCPDPLTEVTAKGGKEFCGYSCGSTQFLYWNGSCFDTCPPPLVSETQGSTPRKFCWYPCMPWQWVYWDGTCQEECNAPLWPEIQGSNLQRQFCWYPCPSETKFLYRNGTCLPECPEPLSTRYENGQWFCDYSCLSTQYLYWNDSCINTCDPPLLSKVEGNPAQKYCYFPCPVDKFAYWDDTCQTACNFPLVPVFEGTPVRKFCWYLCPTNQFLYWNSTCSTQCDPPLLQRTTNNRQYCDYPCLSDEYLYWNQSCKSTCLYPLVTQVQGTVLPKSSCLYPCPLTQFLYWNGTCDINCPYPLIQETQGTPQVRKFCHFPCQPTQYLFWNGSCIETCPSPLTPEAQGSRLFCWPTCDANKFLYWNGSCFDDCPSPLLPETQQPLKKFCWYPCKTSQWVYWDQTCQDSCPSPLLSEIQGSRQFCWYPCASNKFLYWNGSCETQCNFPLSQRTTNSQKFCDYPCKSYQYLYWNGSCLDSCPGPLSPRLEGGTPFIQYCDYLCPASQVLYWDGACLPTCDSPLVLNTQGSPLRSFCWYLCSINDYLYWNGTCLNQCNYPLSKKTFRGRNFCTYACADQKYLAPDGTCVNSCPLEYFENVDLGFCQPCQDSLCLQCSSSSFGTKCQQCKDSYILNFNGICQDCETLSSEFIQQIDTYTYQYKITLSPASCDLDETTLRQSLLPTQNTKNQFPTFSYQINQTADFNGEYFLLEIQFKQAVSTDSSFNFAIGSLRTGLQIPKTSNSVPSTADTEVKATFAAVTGSTLGAALTVGATAALWSLISFQQFISYFIYLNIQLPSHLLYFLTMFDNVNLEILPNPLASLTDHLAELWDSLVNNADPKYQLPNKFAEYNTPTLFVINAGSTFFICLLLFILPYFFDFLRKYRDLGRQKFMVNIHSGLRWNIPIRVFLESGISLTFAFLIQMRKISYSNVPYAISTVTASLAFIYLAFMINYIYQTLRNFKYEDLKDSRVEESIGTLFEGLLLKKEKPSGKYYYLFILFRGMLLVFMGVFVDHLPLVQTTVMALFNLFFVYYVCVIIEFQSRYLTWANRIKEVLILAVELLFMTLSSKSTTEEWRNLAGWVIICMLGLTLAMELLFGFYLQILAARDFVKKMKEIVKRVREDRKKRKQRIGQEPAMVAEESSRNILKIET